MKQFHEKYGPWAFVTGASSGLGKAIALELAQRGIHIILNARNLASLTTTAHEIESLGVQSKIIAGDISDLAFIDSLTKEFPHQKIGLLVAAAGFGSAGAFADTNLDNELNMIDVNCKAVLKLTHYFANQFIQQQHGGIILFGSLVGFQGTPFAANYAATKAYIQVFSEGIHHELKQKGVDVLCVAPGPVATGFGIRAHMKMGRAAKPETLSREIVSSLGKKTTIKPGFLSKFLISSLSILPRWLRIRIMAKIMGNMSTTYEQN